MCTFAWGTGDGGAFWCCFNRDEQRSRAVAEPPVLHEGGGKPAIYGRDPEGGGTWFALSPSGFVVALLNHYPEGGEGLAAERRSRGLLVRELAHAPSAADAVNRFMGTDLSPYPPFFLFLVTPLETAAFAWDGSALTFPVPEIGLWTTSSVRPEAVTAWRRRRWAAAFAEQVPVAEEAARLMRERCPEDPSLGFTMDRPDARTVSQVEMQWRKDGIRFAYRERDATGWGYQAPVVVCG